ncbi:type 1 glutamine amidotransferase domain-containing protein [Shewanella intestini]|uniref:Type 1 glutamine amidotransferase domain-containing protein n=1 Tax=Shewanella intestini TaxID=2017544 RepID=A0ABS5I5C5_9GAMM|nr:MULTISPECIES: type 1 glutamine amidotransferase domain-containing protein [Shewanella]MBR9729033.1 type 1 glutamine amidotransferase domain-containing protein [Shewanella intestini]MRG36901.1 type 1 glutamine amidotransferase domain-containing protein [Shewanella sp. XMDDZSB0408]
MTTQANNHKRILMVLTSHDKLGDSGHKTGFWVEEFAAPFYAFVDAGWEITLASPLGGHPPIDPNSELADFQTDATRRFDQDNAAKNLLANTKKLTDINSNDFDGVFYPGGHGPLWDLYALPASIELVETFIAQNKPVAAVCHATAVLLNAKDPQGKDLVAQKAITGFSNSEEHAVQLADVVPYLLEDELVKRHADYQKVADWHPFSVQDGLIITGQNPASSEITAQKLIAHFQS